MKNITLPPQLKQKLNDLGEQLKNADQKTIYYIFGGVLLFIFLLDYFVIMRPQINTLTKLTPEISEMKGNVERTETNLLRLNDYRAQIKDFKNKVAQLGESVSAREEVPLLLEKISRMALENGVKINQIMPRPDSQELVLEQNDRDYYTLPVSVEAKSSYHAFGRFLNEIENDDMFFKPQAFVIAKGNSGRNNSIKLIIEAIVYEEK